MIHLCWQHGIDVENVIWNELVIEIEINLRKERCIIYILHTITITTTNTPIKIEILLMISNGMY